MVKIVSRALLVEWPKEEFPLIPAPSDVFYTDNNTPRNIIGESSGEFWC